MRNHIFLSGLKRVNSTSFPVQKGNRITSEQDAKMVPSELLGQIKEV